MSKMKILCSQSQPDRQTGRKVQRMRNIIVILALFVCTSICLGVHTVNITGRNDGADVCGNGRGNKGCRPADKDPSGNIVDITGDATNIGNVYGAWNDDIGIMTDNEVNVHDINPNCGDFESKCIYGAYSMVTGDAKVNDNKVKISGGFNIKHVYGGYLDEEGTATLNTVNLTSVTVSSDVYGARIGKGRRIRGVYKNGYASSNTVTITSGAVKNVYGGYVLGQGTATLNKVNLTSVTVSSNVYGGWIDDSGYASSNTVTIIGGKIGGNVFGGRTSSGTVSSNTVTITSGAVHAVYGGYIEGKGTATLNKVNLTSVTVNSYVYGARIGNGLARDNRVTIIGGKIEGNVFGGRTSTGTVSSNTVTITSGAVRAVFGGYIVNNGTATLNKVHLTSVTVGVNVFGAKIEKDGLASSNTVTITGGRVGKDVYGGYVSTGTASSNTVTITGGKTGGNVFGGYVGGNGKAIYNTITITGSVEFSTITILCGGICANKATADASTNDAFTGNTLNIVETKGVVVNGISNFENYNFHLKDIKHGETILTATSGGCSWDVVRKGYTTACTVDLSSSNIHLRTQSVINKDEYCTLIKSPQGFKDNISCKQFSFDNEGLVEYSWEIKIADNEQDLIAMLNRKEIRKEKAKPLLEGNVTGMVCINNGMDCIISKMEETESVLGEGAKLQRKGEIGAFYGLLANKSSYDDTGSHIDMTGMSMMGGIGIRWKGLVTGAFGEYGTGNSDIDSGPCPCKKKSEGKSKYVGGGLLGRYNVCENEFRGTKLYLEAILRAGEVSNTFNIKEAKDGAEKECKYNDETMMYGGCALGGGYKHKVGEKMDVDWSLRYMFGYQDGKDVEKPVDVYGNRVKLESVTSSRIRIGVRGKYVELEKVKPYIGIWYEHELSGKVKGAIQNGVDNVGDIPATSFEGGTGIVELGVSVKVGKLDVGISGQGYLGVRKGFGGMLKLKYAFGKDAHAKPPKPQPKDK